MVHHTKRPIVEPTRVYSREEVAEVLNVSLSTVKRLIAGRRLRASQPPGMRRVLILGQHILDFLVSTEIRDGVQFDDPDAEANPDTDVTDVQEKHRKTGSDRGLKANAEPKRETHA